MVLGKKDKIRGYILEEIRLNNLKSGDKLFSRFQLMDRFSCARATVDQAVQELVGMKILVSEKGLGTFVGAPKKRIATKTIGVLGPLEGKSPFIRGMLNGVFDGLGGEYPVLGYNYRDIKLPKIWGKVLNFQALVFIRPDVYESSFLAEVQRRKIPHIVAYRNPPESSFISIDNRQGAATLVNHFAKKGITKFGFLGEIEDRYEFSEQRFSGFLEGLLQNGLSYNKKWVAFSTPQNAEKTAAEFFKNPDLPQVLISGFFPLGILFRELRKKNREDIQIGSFLTVDENTYGKKIPSLDLVVYQVGVEAAKGLLKILKKPKTVIQKLINPPLMD